MIKIYFGTEYYEIEVKDSSSRIRSLSEDYIQLDFDYFKPLQLPVGAKVEFLGQVFELKMLEDFKMISTKNYSYTLRLYSDYWNLRKFIIRDVVEKRLKFSITLTPRQHVQLIVDNMNMRESGWTVGNCIDEPEQTISYNLTNCKDALQIIADAYNSEAIVEGKEISLKTLYGSQTSALPLKYGKGNGVISGVERKIQEDGRPVTHVCVQGGSQNIDPHVYGYSELRLPRNASLRCLRSTFEDFITPTYQITFDQYHINTEHYSIIGGEVGSVTNPPQIESNTNGGTFVYLPTTESWVSEQENIDMQEAVDYRTDSEGLTVFITPSDVEKNEEGLDLTSIFPSRLETITAIEIEEATTEDETDFVNIICSNIPQSINYRDYIIAGKIATIIFQSGRLAGKEFDILTDDNGELIGYVPEEKKFKLVPVQYDGIYMPNTSYSDGVFMPEVGDTFKVFNIELPSAYIADNELKIGAEWDMFREAVLFLQQRREFLYSYTLKLDPILARERWNVWSERIKVGNLILFSHDEYEPTGAYIRIIQVTQPINNYRAIEIELSNKVSKRNVSSNIRIVPSIFNEIEHETSTTLGYVLRGTNTTNRQIGDVRDTATESKKIAVDGLSWYSIKDVDTSEGSMRRFFTFQSKSDLTNDVIKKIPEALIFLEDVGQIWAQGQFYGGTGGGVSDYTTQLVNTTSTDVNIIAEDVSCIVVNLTPTESNVNVTIDCKNVGGKYIPVRLKNNYIDTVMCNISVKNSNFNEVRTKQESIKTGGIFEFIAHTSDIGSIIIPDWTLVESYLNISPSAITLNADGIAVAITVDSNVEWIVPATVSWDNGGSITTTINEDGFTVQSTENVITESRINTLSVTSEDGSISKILTITQEAASAYLTISPTSISIPQAGGTSIEVEVDSNVEWIIPSTVSWDDGSGNNITTQRTANGFTVQTTSNGNTENRTKTINVTTADGTITRTLSITQAGEQVYLSINPTSVTIPQIGGTSMEVEVYSNVEWTVPTSVAWEDGSGDLITVNAPDTSLKVISLANNTLYNRTAIIEVTAIDYPLTAELTVIQNSGTGKIILRNNKIIKRNDKIITR